MFIQTKSTPNPNSLQFLLDFHVSPKEPIFFSNKEDCSGSILARKLFSIENVKEVFFGANFITITKEEKASWEIVKSDVLRMMMDHFAAQMPIFDEKHETIKEYHEVCSRSEIEKQIIEILDTKVRPSVAMDGGDIVYVGFENGVVKLKMRGACSGCPSASFTLKNGIESLLKYYIPEVKTVESVENT